MVTLEYYLHFHDIAHDQLIIIKTIHHLFLINTQAYLVKY